MGLTNFADCYTGVSKEFIWESLFNINHIQKNRQRLFNGKF
jgi:hypothetical protein